MEQYCYYSSILGGLKCNCFISSVLGLTSDPSYVLEIMSPPQQEHHSMIMFSDQMTGSCMMYQTTKL